MEGTLFIEKREIDIQREEEGGGERDSINH